MSHMWMCHVTHMTESCHTYEYTWRLVKAYRWWSIHMFESCHTYEWVMPHIWTSHVTHMNESCHTCEWVMSHMWMRHITHGNVSNTHMGWLWLVGSLTLLVSFAKVPYKRDDILQKRPIILRSLLILATPYEYRRRLFPQHTHDGPFVCLWHMCHIWMSHVTHMNESCHTYEWVMSHIEICRPIHINETCHTYKCT